MTPTNPDGAQAGGELKPCPWCHTLPVHQGERTDLDKPFEYWVACYNANCQIHPTTLWYATDIEAIAVWNNRAQGAGGGE